MIESYADLTRGNSSNPPDILWGGVIYRIHMHTNTIKQRTESGGWGTFEKEESEAAVIAKVNCMLSGSGVFVHTNMGGSTTPWDEYLNEKPIKKEQEIMKEEKMIVSDELNITPIESKMIPIDEIEPHPDALGFWGDADAETNEQSELSQDEGALHNSVARNGNALAALVVRKDDDSGWWLLDGCGRMAGAKKGGRSELYCTVLDVNPEQYQKLIMEVNMNRHRVSTPGRVLRYMELYQNEILEVAEENADPKTRGTMGGRGNKAGSGGTTFTLNAIRLKLHCRKQDVSGGILLLKSKRDDAVPYMDKNKKWQLRPATGTEIEKRDKVISSVRKGKTPLNRWAQGIDGKLKTDGEVRAKTNYADVLNIATTKLNTSFTNWHEIAAEARPGLIREFCKVMHDLPQDFHRDFLDVVQGLYPELFVEKGKK